MNHNSAVCAVGERRWGRGVTGVVGARSLARAALLPIVIGAAVFGARAQDGTHQGYVERVKPDVQIVVMPLPTGEWGVSTVYPTQVPHSDSERRLKSLLTRTNWKANGIEYVDSSLDLKRRDGKTIDRSASDDKDAPEDPVMSEVTFATPANIVDIAGGTIDMSPFALAFDDLSHVNVVFFIPAKFQFQFRGLRHFEDPRLSLDMASGQGTYTYLMNIKDHRMTSLVLPKYEQSAPVESAATKALRARARTVQTLLVIALAGIVGCIVYLWATKLVGGNSSSSRG